MSCPSRSQSVASQTRFAVRSAARMAFSAAFDRDSYDT